MYKLVGDTLSLGRDATNDISIEDPEVSRYHLRLKWQGDGYTVEDLGSTNGTRINSGARIQSTVKLQPGQALMLGDAIILSYEAVSG
ncbi:MAG: FHA domain-containing protein [Anaerolineae bacterium]|nr:FHA domain-containing protein [Anaerolineae bacterium]